MTHLLPVHATTTVVETAANFVDAVFRHCKFSENIVSDRDLLFTYAFWTSLSEIPGTKLKMSIAAHSETDGQTERMKRVL